MSVTVGQEAPDFTLVNQDGESVTLSDLRGRKVVLVFYPFAFSGLCTDEWCNVRDRIGAFDDDTVLLGISVDTKHALKAYKAAEGLGYDLLSDFWPHGAIAQAYGVFLPDRGHGHPRLVRPRPRGRRALGGRRRHRRRPQPRGLPRSTGRDRLTPPAVAPLLAPARATAPTGARRPPRPTRRPPPPPGARHPPRRASNRVQTIPSDWEVLYPAEVCRWAADVRRFGGSRLRAYPCPRARGAAGSATRLHRVGRRFEPGRAHHRL